MENIASLSANTKRGIFVLIVFCTLALKLSFFDYQYLDYILYLSDWIAKIQEGGGIVALKDPFYNYTPMYLYVLVGIAKLEQVLGINTLYAIKIFSVVFEYILAYFIGKIASLYSKNDLYMWLSLIIIPLVPAVVLDSSVMSQCDSVYCSFVVASVYFLLRKKQLFAILLLGVAFSLKLQTAFILPFYFVYMLRGYIKWYYFLLIPVVYFISILPVWIAGRPLGDLLAIYADQSGYNVALVVNFPNIYIWIDQLIPKDKTIYMAIFAVFVLLFGFELSRKKYTFTLSSWLKLAFLGALICPYFLPGMLDRYLYLGDVLVVLYIFLNWTNFPIALGVWFISYLSRAKTIIKYSFLEQVTDHYFFIDMMRYVPWKLGGIVFIAIIIYVAYDLLKEIKSNTALKLKEVSVL